MKKLAYIIFICVSFQLMGQNLMNHMFDDLSLIQTSLYGKFGYSDFDAVAMFHKKITVDDSTHNMYSFRYSKMNDTIFIIDIPTEEGGLICYMWNKLDTIKADYCQIKYNVSISNQALFKIVGEWNIPMLQKYSVPDPNKTYHGYLPIYASRVIIKNGKYIMECTKFYDYNIEVQYNPFSGYMLFAK